MKRIIAFALVLLIVLPSTAFVINEPDIQVKAVPFYKKLYIPFQPPPRENISFQKDEIASRP